MLDIRHARVRAMVARGEVPHGQRVNDDGTGFASRGNPAWPVRPLDPHCTTYGEPSIELMLLIRKVIPEFDPETNRRAWPEVAEFVRRRGRMESEIYTMGHEELVVFFRYEAFQAERNGPNATEPLTPADKLVRVRAEFTSGDVQPQAAAAGPPPRESAAKILRRMLNNPTDRLRLLEAGSAAGVGRLIKRSASAVKEAGHPWDELKELLLIHRTNRRTSREMKNGRKS